MAASGLRHRDDGSDDNSDDETTPFGNEIYGGSQRTVQETKGWDVFRDPPVKQEGGSMETQKCLEITVKICKILAYILTFVIVLAGGVISKGTLLFMTSQLEKGRKITYCNHELGRDKQFLAEIPEAERVAWMWCIYFAFLVPEIGAFIRSLRICFFKSWKKPTYAQFILVFLIETLHTVGLVILFFIILPNLDVVKAAMLTNCMCLIPGLFGMLSRSQKESKRFIKVIVDLFAIAAQITGFVAWPLVGGDPSLWLIPLASILISLGWWENYVSKNSPWAFMKALSRVKEEMNLTRYFTYCFVTIWKMIAFLCCILLILWIQGETVGNFFTLFETGFGEHNILVEEFTSFEGPSLPDLSDVTKTGDSVEVIAIHNTAVYVLLIQILAAYMCYIFGKFACKILIQGFSYAFPVNLTIPVTISFLIAACGIRNGDPCAFQGTIPPYLFFNSPRLDVLEKFISQEMAWVWLLWLLSQTWITLHIWTPKCERLASTEKLFVIPMYNSLLIDQSLGMNRRCDDQTDVKTEELAEMEKEKGDEYYETISVNTDGSNSSPKTVKSSDHITRIYACATMWHETKEEMIEFLKSIFRLDEDQCARRIAQKYLRVVDPDYYEFETHIFLDDGFEVSDHSKDDFQVNMFVKRLVGTIDEAASEVHQTHIRIRPPKKFPTPYGGRLEWVLPGKTKMICHLKDNSKIRHRKRWSQVMYMYYLLGHRLMELPISVDRKEVMAENTFLLTLDGDIDFQPHAVQLLVDLMKKNKNLGAACGRIHPIGSGPMVWYQMFEYAIGHWLQKATEHMIGCVLCSPGCFSLFRAKALMDDNVMRKYTTKSDEARHYVQYDQGEDRWLCTLILQRGYRVEYSAASDAYTHCPEGFNEFYNQRRRWVPSTMANIFDLLMDYKRTVKINDNISMPYISYLMMLMGGTVLGPGTIFLMLVGAFVAAFKIDNWTSFYYNIIPIILFMIVCFTCKSSIQLMIAQILSTGYAMIMMAVIVGTALQLGEDGIGSPSAIFLIALTGSFLIAACLHPQEFWCIVPGIIYLLSIPSMYLLLILYSIINLNVVSWGTREVPVKKTKKLFFARLISTIYGLIMMAVLVGLGLQIMEDGWFAPSSLFLFIVAGELLVAALIHPQEFYCFPAIIIYYITIPSMYLLLIIYSLFNLNDITWGTRVVKEKKTPQQIEEEALAAEEAKKQAKNKTMLSFLGSKNNDEKGSFEFSFAGLFKCMFCTYPEGGEERAQLMYITDSLDQMKKKMDVFERAIEPTAPTTNRRRSTLGGAGLHHLGPVSEDGEDNDDETNSETLSTVPKEERDNLCNPYWIDDPELGKGETDYLLDGELQFWNDLLARYLYPIDENVDEKNRIAQDLKDLRDRSVFGFFMLNALFVLIVFLLQLHKDELHIKWPFGVKTNITYDESSQEARIASDLMELRNKSVFAFFMFNALFVLIVFLLQLNKDQLHVDWPLGIKTNITYIEETGEVHISKEYLQLEPIGLVFVVFFALILVIQFTAMLFHRFGTLSHILASTELNWYCSKKPEEMSQDAILDKNAVAIVKDWQKLHGIDDDYENDSGSGPDRVGRRKTVHNLEKARRKKRQIGTLDVAFKKRFYNMNSNGGPGTPILNRNVTMRRETIKALETRRNSLMAEKRKSQMQTLGANNEYGISGINNNGGIPVRSMRTSNAGISIKDVFPDPNGGQVNRAYEPALGDDDTTSLRLQPRQSQVTFQPRY